MSTENEKPTLIEERLERAPRNLYGGRILEKKGRGFTRRIFVLTCDLCGLRIGNGDRLRACATDECKAKVCENCFINYEGQTYCRHCLKLKLEIDESDFDVLNVIIAAKRISIPAIANQLAVSLQSVRKSLPTLLKANLIRRRSVSVLTQFEPTPIAIYNQLAIAKLFDTTTQTYERDKD
jgi:predicted transcriptional regulator